MIFLITILCSIVFCIKVDYIDAYYDNENNYDLYNPQINSDGTIISAEVYTKKAQQAKSYQSDTFNEDQIIFFKNNGNCFESFQLYKKFKPRFKLIKPWRPTNLLWSNEGAEFFYSVLPGDNGVNLTLSQIDTLKKDQNEDQVMLVKEEADGYEFMVLNNPDNWEGLEFDANIISMHRLLYEDEHETDYRYILFYERDSRGTLYPIIKSDHPDFDEIKQNDIAQSNGCINSVSSSDCPITDSYETGFSKFDVTKNGRYLDYVLQIRNDDYQSSILFSRYCFNGHIPIIHSNGSLDGTQKNPQFNSNGNLVAFLYRKDVRESILFDLYIVDVIKGQEKCTSYKNNYIDSGNPLELNYQLIDSNVMDEDFYNSGERTNFTSYCWHPERNIIFYIKSDGDNHPIYYFDLDNNQRGKLDIPTKNNKYINISNDGQYLLFSFIGIEDEARKNNFQFNNSKGLDSLDVLRDFGNNKIGVARLIYD